ncbi:MAG: MFS transporter [Steroidobacteraceae bacterium]
MSGHHLPDAGSDSAQAQRKRQLRRAVIASTVGTTIEWYDFFLYSTVTGLVFGKLFFPGSNPAIATLQAFLIYAVGFASRPIGAAIFGHYGDRIGRKSTLIATLLLMGSATVAVGLVPGYAHIGIWGAIILAVLRFIQGIGVGGEWGGSVLLAMEWSHRDDRRGFIASWPQFGVPAGLFLANLAVLGFSAGSGSAFLAWGWRVPFLLSSVLVIVGLFIRLRIEETPTFRRVVAENRVEKAPTREVIRRQPARIVQSALLRMIEQSSFYIYTAFIFAYGIQTLDVSRNFLLSAVLVAACIAFVAIPVFGYLSDRIGRKRMYLIGTVVSAVFGFVYFAVLRGGNPTLVFLILALSLIPFSMVYGPEAALIAECFTARLRYSGASLGYQLASLIAGGPAPLIATYLVIRYRSGFAVAAYIAVCAVISIVATAFVPDYTNKNISAEYEHV